MIINSIQMESLILKQIENQLVSDNHNSWFVFLLHTLNKLAIVKIVAVLIAFNDDSL